MTPFAEFRHVGTVVRPHGVRGEVLLHVPGESNVAAWLDVPVQLQSLQGTIWRTTLQSVQRHVKLYRAKLREVDDRHVAQSWQGAALQLHHTAIAAPLAGEFYLFELLQARVVDQQDRCVGHVQALHSAGQQNFLLLSAATPAAVTATTPTCLLPIQPHFVKRFERPSHTLHVFLPEGLWESPTLATSRRKPKLCPTTSKS